jgi:hypothetical protein
MNMKTDFERVEMRDLGGLSGLTNSFLIIKKK